MVDIFVDFKKVFLFDWVRLFVTKAKDRAFIAILPVKFPLWQVFPDKEQAHTWEAKLSGFVYHIKVGNPHSPYITRVHRAKDKLFVIFEQ